MPAASEDELLRQIAEATKSAEWFPDPDEFIDRENMHAVEALISEDLVTPPQYGPFLCLRARALRRIRGNVPFARQELERAVELLEHLQDKMVKPRAVPQSMDAMRVALGWVDTNQVRRATFLLWLEIRAIGIEVSWAKGNVPLSLAANKYIWSAKPEDLLNEPVPVVIDSELVAIAEEKKGTVKQMSNRKVFIGHGGSLVWLQVKDFIRDRLNLPWEEFNREPTAGMATKERLEAMLDGSVFAFLVMTAEDEQADGSKHARANVIHEVGLFQGRLGFKRAIVLLEDGCEEFSNIHGITQIRFPKGRVSAAFEDIRRVLEREKILPSTEASAGLRGVSPPPPLAPEPGPQAAPLRHGGGVVHGFDPAMHDDEARTLLEAWLVEIADSVHNRDGKTPQLRDPADIAGQAGVPVAKVSLLASVAQENEHLGVKVSQLAGGKVRLDIGAASVRDVRGRRKEWEE